MARTSADLRWWRQKKSPHSAIEAALKAAQDADTNRREEDQHHLRLYSEREWTLHRALFGTQRSKYDRPRKRRRLSVNVVRNNIDGWVNLICKSRPHVTYLTKGADWGLQKKARLRTRFVEAHFLKRNLYQRANLVAKHAGIFGSGFVQVVKAHSRIDYEIVMPGELVADPSESAADDPRSLYRLRTGGIDVAVAKELWPEKAKDIEVAAAGQTRVPYCDAWHLPSGPDADDGLHVQCIPGKVTLGVRKYKWQAFPIVKFSFDDAPIGWFGSGIAEELGGIQFELNSIHRTIASNAYMGGNLKVAVKRGSNVSQGALSNQLGVPVIEYNDQPPTFFTHDIASQQLFQRAAQLQQLASEIVGISQMNIESKTPFATMSGRARLAADDAYSRRFVTHQQRWEGFYNSLADRTLEAAADLADDGEDIEVLFPGREFLEVVRYSDVAGEENDFDAQAWSASLAGETVAGRLDQIQQMLSIGMIDLAGAMNLFEVPHDLRAHMEMTLAPIELARQVIDRIVEDGEPMTPTPMMDLAMAAKYAQLWYQRGVLRGADPQRLYLLLDFHKMALMLLQQSQPQAAANAAPAGAPSPLSGQTLPVAPAAPQLGAA
jgi:hypothetical protein